jgi:hypothetical protein
VPRYTAPYVCQETNQGKWTPGCAGESRNWCPDTPVPPPRASQDSPGRDAARDTQLLRLDAARVREEIIFVLGGSYAPWNSKRSALAYLELGICGVSLAFGKRWQVGVVEPSKTLETESKGSRAPLSSVRSLLTRSLQMKDEIVRADCASGAP